MSYYDLENPMVVDEHWCDCSYSSLPIWSRVRQAYAWQGGDYEECEDDE